MKPNVRISCRQVLAVSLTALTVFPGLITTPATAGGGDVAAGLLGGLAVGALVGSAAAIVFTLPKDDALTGATRCIRRMGLLRGDNIKMRYRRLDFECSRTKTEASIAISRGTDE